MNGKIVVTGSKGMLGFSLLSLLNYENIVGLDSKFDITDSKLVTKILEKEKPNIIIHTAAYTDVESCETNVEKAYLINTLGTQNLVNYCIDKNILFIYISSTGIYGNESKEQYSEFDDVNPQTIHHKSKFEAEKVVQNHLYKYLILRTGWLYGGEKTHNKNFVYKRFIEAKSKDIIYSDNTQIGNPTYIIDLIKQIEILIDNRKYGIFNCVNKASEISRYDYVKKIIEIYNLKCDVKVAPNGMFKRVAPVSKNESAVNFKLNLLNLNVMGSWEESLSKYIQQLKSES